MFERFKIRYEALSVMTKRPYFVFSTIIVSEILIESYVYVVMKKISLQKASLKIEQSLKWHTR